MSVPWILRGEGRRRLVFGGVGAAAQALVGS